MAQNIYDDAAFQARYARLPRSADGLSGAPEWAALRAMLPAEFSGLDVLDLGCGYGAFCRFAAEAGAARVTGIDLSARMLAEAARRHDGLGIVWQRADLDTIALTPGAHDLVFSSLAVHYLADFGRLCAEVRASLKPAGRFVFSMEHPIFAARGTPEFVASASAGERPLATLRDYLIEGERVTDWLAPGVVKYHRTIASVLTALQARGLLLEAIDEWRPSAAQLAQHPDWNEALVRPMYLLVATRAAA